MCQMWVQEKVALAVLVYLAFGQYLPRDGPSHFCRGHIHQAGQGDALLSGLVHLRKARRT